MRTSVHTRTRERERETRPRPRARAHTHTHTHTHARARASAFDKIGPCENLEAKCKHEEATPSEIPTSSLERSKRVLSRPDRFLGQRGQALESLGETCLCRRSFSN